MVASALALGGWWYFARAGGPPMPVILISVDTLRADHLPVYGYTKVKTPAIDALASDGIVFERAYAHAPQTLPSHTAILTGQLPFETGVRDNIGFILRGDQETLAGRLRTRGYLTGGVVSAFVLRKETGISRGFDFFDDEMPPSAPDMPMGQVRRSGGDSLAVAERWMQTLTSPRFFLFFHTYDPHMPYRSPDRFKQYGPYDGEIAYSDEVVGQLMAWLKERGWYDRALIVFLSDHGEGLGDHGEAEHGRRRRCDRDVHEGRVGQREGRERLLQPGEDLRDPVRPVRTAAEGRPRGGQFGVGTRQSGACGRLLPEGGRARRPARRGGEGRAEEAGAVTETGIGGNTRHARDPRSPIPDPRPRSLFVT